MLKVQLLGPPRVWVGEKAITHFPTGKSLALLAYLVLEARHPQPRDVLCTLLWPESDEYQARRSLSQELSRLRRTLGRAGDLIEADLQTISLNHSHIVCDVNEVINLLNAIERHTHPKLIDCSDCQTHLDDALAMMTGELLAGVTLRNACLFEEWLMLERGRLHELYLSALQHSASAALAKGQYDRAIERAQRQIGLEPWRESAHRQLMQALALSGRRNEALNHFEACRQQIAAELGVEPSQATYVLAEQIKNNTLAPAADNRQPDQASTQLKHNLPAPLLPTIGREAEISDIVESFEQQQARLVTICGPGGIGKTRLAQEVGRQMYALSQNECGDGIWFVPLVGVESESNIPLAVADVLGLHLSEREAAGGGVIRQLRERRLLLILDNFEHVLEGRHWVVELLRAAPQVRVLVTSRERLKLMAEDVYMLGGLALPPEGSAFVNARDYGATRLFLDGARRINKNWRLTTDNWPYVVAICNALGGLPLGIKLAIALLESADAATIAERIEALWPADRELLASDFSDIAAHQRNLYGVFAQSWERLTDEEQRALARLSVIHGAFELPVARVVGATTAAVIKRLQYKSLLRAVGNGQLDMHPLVRQFAALQLQALSAEATGAQRQHAHYFLTLAAAYARQRGAEQRKVLSILRRNVRNLQTGWMNAIALGEIDLLSEAAEGLGHFLTHSSLYSEARRLFRALRASFNGRMADMLTEPERELYGQAVVREAGTWADLQIYAESNAILDAASDVLHTVSDPHVLATVDYHRGRSALHQGDGGEALVLLQRGLRYARQVDDYRLEVNLLRHTGSVYRQQGDYHTFLDYLEEALRICRRYEDLEGEQVFLYFIGAYRAYIGDYWRGRALVLAALALDSESGAPYYRWASEATLGVIEVLLGQASSGIARQERALAELQALDENWRIVSGLVDLATAQMTYGRFAAAANSLATARSLAEQRHLVELAAYVALAAAHLAAAQADYRAASQAFAAAESQMAALGRQIGVVEAQIMRAYCEQQLGEGGVFAAESVHFVAGQRLDGAQQRELLYWTAYQVAAAAGFPEAGSVLACGRKFVAGVVAQIDDPNYRVSYLTQTAAALLMQTAEQIV